MSKFTILIGKKVEMKKLKNTICEQLKKNGTTSDITYPDDSKYTYLVLIDGINQALKKASK